MADRTTDADRLAALAAHLSAHKFGVELTGRGLVVTNPAVSACCAEAGRSCRADTITCRPYDKDGGRAWFFTSWREPIAEAERVTDAVVVIKGYLSGDCTAPRETVGRMPEDRGHTIEYSDQAARVPLWRDRR